MMDNIAPRKKILVAGGSGYIGAHICVELISLGYDVVVIDNFSNSRRETIDAIRKITSKSVGQVRSFDLDCRDEMALAAVMQKTGVQAVIHLANFKAVAESVAEPLRYYDNNLGSTLALLKAMEKNNLRTLIFSSSATVYGIPVSPRISEDFVMSPYNVYGRTKWMVEKILSDLQAADKRWKIASLRYFNPVGAHSSGLIGENLEGKFNNLFPAICQVLMGVLPRLEIFGADYNTRDGTGERDYIHVCDLARAHTAALSYLLENEKLGSPLVLNLGVGSGHTVKEVIATFEQVSNVVIPYVIMSRRAGDIDAYFADPQLAYQTLGWQAECDLKQMCVDTWRWLEARHLQYS